MTFDTKLTMALAGCSGSCSANRWHTLSVALPCFLATNPKTLQETRIGQSSQKCAAAHMHAPHTQLSQMHEPHMHAPHVHALHMHEQHGQCP